MQQIKIHDWNGIRYSAGDVALVVVPDLGGRIISLTVSGREIFFVQKEHAGETFDFTQTTDLRRQKKQLGFRVWGGDKTWIAPERDWWEKIPPLELDAGCYKADAHADHITMISPVCRETGLQITRTVTMEKNGTVVLDQTVTNRGPDSVCKGIWNVTQLQHPCDVHVPAPLDSIRSYHKEDATLPDHSIVLTQDGALTCIPCRDRQMFKFGGMLGRGHLLSIRMLSEGQVAFLKSFSIDMSAPYLHRSMLEVFNAKDHDYLEVEIHAPAVILKPGDSFSHQQNWRLKCYGSSASPQDIYHDLTSQ